DLFALDGDVVLADAVRGDDSVAADNQVEHLHRSSGFSCRLFGELRASLADVSLASPSSRSSSVATHCSGISRVMNTNRVFLSCPGQASSHSGGWNTCCTP